MWYKQQKLVQSSCMGMESYITQDNVYNVCFMHRNSKRVQFTNQCQYSNDYNKRISNETKQHLLLARRSS